MYFRWNSFDDLFSKRNSCPVQIFLSASGNDRKILLRIRAASPFRRMQHRGQESMPPHSLQKKKADIV